jgi:hypothetical protein
MSQEVGQRSVRSTFLVLIVLLVAQHQFGEGSPCVLNYYYFF